MLEMKVVLGLISRLRIRQLKRPKKFQEENEQQENELSAFTFY